MINNVMLSAASLDFTICVSFFASPGEKRHTRKEKYHAAAGESCVYKPHFGWNR
jgi:hypothetical protein